MVLHEFWRYGYDLVKSGRLNKEEAAVVHLIFNKYTLEGYGAQRISTYLNNQGYRTRAGRTDILPLFVEFSAI